MIPQNNYLRSFTRAAISPVCLNSLLRHLYIIHNNAWAKLICVNLAFAHLIAGCSPKTKLDEIVITSSSYESVCLALKLSWNRRYSWSIFLAFTLSFHECVHSNQLIIAFSPSFLKGEAFSLHFFIGTLIFSLLCPSVLHPGLRYFIISQFDFLWSLLGLHPVVFLVFKSFSYHVKL